MFRKWALCCCAVLHNSNLMGRSIAGTQPPAAVLCEVRRPCSLTQDTCCPDINCYEHGLLQCKRGLRCCRCGSWRPTLGRSPAQPLHRSEASSSRPHKQQVSPQPALLEPLSPRSAALQAQTPAQQACSQHRTWQNHRRTRRDTMLLWQREGAIQLRSLLRLQSPLPAASRPQMIRSLQLERKPLASR